MAQLRPPRRLEEQVRSDELLPHEPQHQTKPSRHGELAGIAGAIDQLASRAFEMQRKSTEAAQVANQYAAAWKYSDVTLTASAF